MRLFDLWGIDTEEQLAMLGLPDDEWAVLDGYRRGHRMTANQEVLQRAGHLLSIHKNLRFLFPRNRELAYRWMSTPNKAFEGRTPVRVIRDEGFLGLRAVKCYLDTQLD